MSEAISSELPIKRRRFPGVICFSRSKSEPLSATRMFFGSRPAFSAYSRNIDISLATSSGSSGIVGTPPIGCQPSPSRAARRIACWLWPPIQIGIAGFCMGLGRKTMLEKLQYLPLNIGLSLVHNSRNAAMYSSVTLPRSLNGSVRIVSNSSFIQPTPAPTITRPPDKTSRLASIFAVTIGLR